MGAYIESEFCAESGKETQRWHHLAASLAGIEVSSLPAVLSFSIADATVIQIAATVKEYSCKLGRIEDLIHELDGLRLNCPSLSSVTAHKTCVALVILGLEAELKFSVQIEIGKPWQRLLAASSHINFAVQTCCGGWRLAEAD